VHVVEVSSNSVSNEDMLCSSICNWCSYLKDELQFSVSEIKSVLECIKFQKDDQKHICETKSEPLSVSTCEGIPVLDSNQCCNYFKLKKTSWKKHQRNYAQ